MLALSLRVFNGRVLVGVEQIFNMCVLVGVWQRRETMLEEIGSLLSVLCRQVDKITYLGERNIGK